MTWVPLDLAQDDADLERDEGLRLPAYQDTRGVWTIGYGHTGSEVKRGLTWTLAEAKAALNADVASTANRLAQALPWLTDLDPVRQDVLLEMAFNLGVAGLCEFKHTLASVECGAYATAAGGMLASRWADEIKVRAQTLAAMMRTGQRA